MHCSKSRAALEYKEWQKEGWIIQRVSYTLISALLCLLMNCHMMNCRVHTHAAVFAWLYHIWLVLGRSSSRPRSSSRYHKPPPQGRTFLRCESCGCWCFLLPSCCGASEHFYPLSYRYVLHRNLAILGTSLSGLHAVGRTKQATF